MFSFLILLSQVGREEKKYRKPFGNEGQRIISSVGVCVYLYIVYVYMYISLSKCID